MTDDWAKSVFSEQELLKLRAQANTIVESHDERAERMEVVSIETMFLQTDASTVVAWLRDQHETNPPGVVSDFLWAAGCNVCFAYLVDPDWEVDEEMSDHAMYFGARMSLDDEDDDDDDDTEE